MALVISWLMAFGAVAVQAGVELTEAEVAEFTSPLSLLQRRLLTTAREMNASRAKVAEYRDLAHALELHSKIVAPAFQGKSVSPFAEFLWRGNVWINRNLALADSSSSGDRPTFADAFQVLRENSDEMIAANPMLQNVLIRVAMSVDSTANLEGLAISPQAPRATLSPLEVELAIYLASISIAFSSSAGSADPQSEEFFTEFLRTHFSQALTFAPQSPTVKKALERLISSPPSNSPAFAPGGHFDPLHSGDVSHLAVQLIGALAENIDTIAAHVPDGRETQVQPATQLLRKVTAVLHRALARWAVDGSSGRRSDFGKSMWTVAPFTMRNLASLANAEKGQGAPVLAQLESELRESCYPPRIRARAATIAAVMAQEALSNRGNPKPVVVAEQDHELVFQLAVVYVQMIPQIVLWQRQAPDQHPAAGELLNGYVRTLSPTIEYIQSHRRLWPSSASMGGKSRAIPYLDPFSPFNQNFPLDRLTQHPSQALRDLESLAHSSETLPALQAQLIRLTRTGAIAHPEDSSVDGGCSWQLVDGLIGL